MTFLPCITRDARVGLFPRPDVLELILRRLLELRISEPL